MHNMARRVVAYRIDSALIFTYTKYRIDYVATCRMDRKLNAECKCLATRTALGTPSTFFRPCALLRPFYLSTRVAPRCTHRGFGWGGGSGGVRSIGRIGSRYSGNSLGWRIYGRGCDKAGVERVVGRGERVRRR